MAEYINRELLKKRFLKRLDWLKKDIHDEYSGALYDCCEVDAGLIDEIPAADVAPVVHGVWVCVNKTDPISGYRCSKCRRRVGFDLTPYCPNCGAKMDGGDNDAAD